MGIDIPSIPADGMRQHWLCPKIADVFNPTVAELTANDVVEIGTYLQKNGFAFQVNQNTLNDERDTDTWTRKEPGRKDPSLDITGVDNTNAVDDTDQPYPNALADALVEGSLWYAVIRRGVPFDQPIKPGDIVDVVKFRVGVKAPVDGDVINSKWTCGPNLIAQGVKVVAVAP